MMKIVQTFAKSIPVLVVLLVVIEIIWSNTLVVSGKEVSSVDLQIVALRATNEQLEQQVASASSLLTIASRAKDAGFVPATSKQFVMIGSETLPVAINLH